jgi:26S proteasome regulatory subunit N10
MTFAGSGPTVLVSPTTEEGKIHVALPSVKATGTVDLLAGLNVAGLALKHRQDKNQRQRAIVLLGSPLSPSLTSEDLVRLGKRLKKNNVAVDVVLFGAEAGENEDRMRAFVEAVNSGGNSQFLVVPAGAPGLLSDHIRQSRILAEEGFGGGIATGPGDGGAGGDDSGFDLDPNLDPELAMALRMSLQEEEARQSALGLASEPSVSTADTSALAEASDSTASGATTERATAASYKEYESDQLLDEGDEKMHEDEELARALAMSRGDDVEMGDADLSEEDAIARAIEMSMRENRDEDQDKDK